MINAIKMSGRDNAAVAIRDINKGGSVIYDGSSCVIAGDDIPRAHRVALTDTKSGEPLIQYGSQFGVSKGIRQGRLLSPANVSTYYVNYKRLVSRSRAGKNVKSGINLLYRQGVADNADKLPGRNLVFDGYKRADGRVGTRNYYVIIPTSLCTGEIAGRIAASVDNQARKQYKNIDGVVAAVHTEGCGCNDGGIIDRLLLTLKNTVMHPNVAGALVIDLGCEKTTLAITRDYFAGTVDKPIDFLSVQSCGGTKNTFNQAIKIVRNRLPKANNVKRIKTHVRDLVIGTECGASDSFSGITANPVIGSVVDMVIANGGSAILTELPEMLGAELPLIKRMKTNRTVDKFIAGIDYYKNLASRLGVNMEGNFVYGNVMGGLLNPVLKSLGAVQKSGAADITDFVDYAERITKPGVSLMNGPGNDLESMTGLAASGATVILFSTGAGTTEGNMIVPVIKISSTTQVYDNMVDDMDFDAGRLITDKNTGMRLLSDKLCDMTLAVCSGKKTKAELWNKHSFQIWTAGKLSL
jgi:altronate hydrolase